MSAMVIALLRKENASYVARRQRRGAGAAQYTRALAVSGRIAWALIDGTLARISPPWSVVSRQVSLYPYPWPPAHPGGGALGYETLATGPARTLWAAGPVLYRVNEATMRARSITGFGTVDNVAVLGQTLWVQADDGVVYQLALHRPSVPGHPGRTEAGGQENGGPQIRNS